MYWIYQGRSALALQFALVSLNRAPDLGKTYDAYQAQKTNPNPRQQCFISEKGGCIVLMAPKKKKKNRAARTFGTLSTEGSTVQLGLTVQLRYPAISCCWSTL